MPTILDETFWWWRHFAIHRGKIWFIRSSLDFATLSRLHSDRQIQFYLSRVRIKSLFPHSYNRTFLSSIYYVHYVTWTTESISTLYWVCLRLKTDGFVAFSRNIYIMENNELNLNDVSLFYMCALYSEL